ncbi:lamin tail domain-containing protein [Patescibacteria group bacterium]|nr:lamin tail domain-containing protein [Patescibacteria group bacterium]MBU1895653.1 lamin tail domain-containing protein [Patescibacteria group bacterium]
MKGVEQNKIKFLIGCILFLVLFCLFQPKIAVARSIIDTPFKSQVPPGLWEFTLNCGQTSLVMLSSFIESNIPSETDIKDVDDWLFKKYGDPINGYSGSVTNVDKLVTWAKEYKNFKESYSGVGGLKWLDEMLSSGQPVIVAVNINMDVGKKGHFMVALQIINSEIIVHDPGKTNGGWKHFPLRTFLDSWATQNNSYVIIKKDNIEYESIDFENEQIQSQETPDNQSSIFTRIKDFFGDLLFDNDPAQSVESQKITTEEDLVEVEEPVYNLQLLNSPEALKVNKGQTEAQITVRAKNIGNTSWEQKKVSINVVGGHAPNEPYKHPTWFTALRPSLLDQASVSPGGEGTFTTKINIPQEPGNYTFRLQVVRQDGYNFYQIGSRFYFLNISVLEEIEEIVVEEIDVQEEEKTLGEKIEQTVEDLIEDVLDQTKETINEVENTVENIVNTVKKFFGGGGGGSSNPPPVDEVIQEEEVIEIGDPEINIISPPSNSITNTSTFEIIGTKNEVTDFVYINSSTEFVSFISSTSWQANLVLSEGENNYEIYGKNSDGDITPTTSVKVVLDSIPPTVPIVSTELNTSATPTINISWSSNDDGVGIANYDMEYKIDEGEWQNLLDNTTSTEYTIEVELLQTYNFRARARDSIDNVSSWSSEDENIVLADWIKTVVINEVSWMGTSEIKNVGKDCKLHNWIELYNPGVDDIDLNGWKLAIDDKEIILDGTIESGGYYLLVKQQGTKLALIEIEVDLAYSDRKIDLRDEGAHLILKDSDQKIIDELNFETGWPAGSITAGPNNNFYQPMGRIDPALPGSYPDNWETISQINPYGKTNNCGALFGSPRKANNDLWLIDSPYFYYGDYYVDGVFTLTPEHNPYIIGSNFNISAGESLHVEPGVIFVGQYNTSLIKIDGGSLFINGTTENPVVFTSSRDKNYCEYDLPNTNIGDPIAGDWSRIEIKNGGSANINNVKFLFGGQSFKRTDGFFATKFMSHVLFITSGDVSVNNSSFINNYTRANYPEYNSVIWIDNSEMVTTTVGITNSLFNTGYTAIKADKINNGVEIITTESNNTFQNFSSPDGPVDLSDLQVPTSTPE